MSGEEASPEVVRRRVLRAILWTCASMVSPAWTQEPEHIRVIGRLAVERKADVQDVVNSVISAVEPLAAGKGLHLTVSMPPICR